MKKTILNSDKACLKRCEELLTIMRKKGLTKFEDPDFGPAYKGDNAKDSIYFGDVPPGYPDPDTITWLRPQKISGEEDGIGKKAQFIDNGASSNDVV